MRKDLKAACLINLVNMCLNMKKAVKKMDFWDIGCIKLGAFMFGMFIVSYFPELVAYMWYFLAVALLAMLRPVYRGYLK